jgi:hypothetical protein
MGFREPLDISEITQQYEVFRQGTSTAEVNFVLPSKARPEEPLDDIPRHLYQRPRMPGEGESPERVGSGPIRCSTSREIVSGRPAFAWDPNRYYRDLWIPWPYVNATRKDLRHAYVVMGGENSPRLTYCFKQLLNPEIRTAYDALPLGEQYLDDIYIQEELKRQAAIEASRRSAQGHYTMAQEVLDDWGFKIVPPEDDARVPDTMPTRKHDQFRYEETVGGIWQYAFYLWRTTRWDITRLSAWQSAMITELSGLCPTLVVGLMGKQPHRFVIGWVDDEPVVFLNAEEEVTPDLAKAATTELMNQMNAQSNTRPVQVKAGTDMTQQPVPNFRRGGDVGDEAAKATGGNFARQHFLSIKEGEQEVVRYLTDSPDWIVVNQHANVPTKAKPADYEGNWPQSMPAVCRYDEAFGGAYKDCYIDDAELKNSYGRVIKATPREWALAVLREEVVGTQAMVDAGEIEPAQVGQRLGYRDQTRDVAERNEKGEETGKVNKEPAIVIVNMAPGNYFTGLNSLFSIYRTVCDRDYIVKRSGSGTDTVYTHIPLDPTPNLHGAYTKADGTKVEATERWLAKYPPAIASQGLDDLNVLIAHRASDEYYGRFFDPNKSQGTTKSDSNGQASKAPDVPDTPADAVDEEKLAAMRDRVRGHAGAASMADVD